MSRQRNKQPSARTPPLIPQATQAAPIIPQATSTAPPIPQTTHATSEPPVPPLVLRTPEVVITVLFEGDSEEIRASPSFTIRRLRELSASIFGIVDTSGYVLI